MITFGRIRWIRKDVNSEKSQLSAINWKHKDKRSHFKVVL